MTNGDWVKKKNDNPSTPRTGRDHPVRESERPKPQPDRIQPERQPEKKEKTDRALDPI